MNTLAPEGKAILQLLVNCIREGRFRPDNPKDFMGYGEAHRRLGIERRGIHWGGSLRKQGMENLAVWLHENGLPAVTGLIVDQKNFLPGDGYFEVNGRQIDDRNWWSDQVRKAIAFDWSPYVEDDTAPSLDELARYEQSVVEGKLSTVEVEVRSRCEALRKRARQYHRSSDGKLRCLVCGWSKPDNGMISGDIVELHHIRQLAKLPVDGQRLTLADAVQSLAPLCPCCHRILHSRTGGGPFTLDQLKDIIPRYPTLPAYVPKAGAQTEE
jgi:5-methylcytosine-specific restriction protein A